MEKKLYLDPGLEGIGIEMSDINSLSDNAANSDERWIAELCSPTGYTDRPYKAVMALQTKFDSANSSAISISMTGDIVRTSIANNLSSVVKPFRVVIRPTVDPNTNNATYSTRDQYRRVYTADYNADIYNNSRTGGVIVAHAATTTGSRWDLLYAAVYVNDSVTSTRSIKSSSGATTTGSWLIYRENRVELRLQAGIEGVSPIRPGMPADTTNVYYVPLGYVLIPAGASTSTQLAKGRYQDPTAFLPRPGETLRPMQFNSRLPIMSGIGDVNTPLDMVDGQPYPRAMLQGAMTGQENRIFQWDSRNFTDGASTVIDSTIDWRSRFLKVNGTIAAVSSANTRQFATDINGFGGADSYQKVIPSMNPLSAGSRAFVAIGGLFGSYGTSCLLNATVTNSGLLGSSTVEFIESSTGELLFRQTGCNPPSGGVAGQDYYIGFLWVEGSAKAPRHSQRGFNIPA